MKLTDLQKQVYDTIVLSFPKEITPQEINIANDYKLPSYKTSFALKKLVKSGIVKRIVLNPSVSPSNMKSKYVWNVKDNYNTDENNR